MVNGQDNEKCPTQGELAVALANLHEAEAELDIARAMERKAEHDIEVAVQEIEDSEHRHDLTENLIVNKLEMTWPEEKISGAEIKRLAGSPDDWVVNQITLEPGDDPEIGNDQFVDLQQTAFPVGIKRFKTRKPKTSPGHD